MYTVMTTRRFERRLAKLPANWQRRIIAKLRTIAAEPYAPHHNATKLQGRNGYRLRVGDWRIIYELQDDQLVMLALEIDSRGGIYK